MKSKKTLGYISKALAAALTLSFVNIAFPAPSAAAETSGASSQAVYDKQFVSERISNNYSRISAGRTAKEYSGEDIVFPFSSASGARQTADTRGYAGAQSVLDMTPGDVAQLSVNVPETALYAVSLTAFPMMIPCSLWNFPWR